jgi:hypothetical protein
MLGDALAFLRKGDRVPLPPIPPVTAAQEKGYRAGVSRASDTAGCRGAGIMPWISPVRGLTEGFIEPERRSMGLVDRLNRIERKRIALLDHVTSLEPPLVVARPLPGAWSIREIVEHLVLAERVVVRDFSGLDTLQAQSRGLKEGALFVVVMLLLRFRIPLKTPSTGMVPKGERSLAELRTMWDDDHRQLLSFVAGLNRRGSRRAIFRHPVTGPLSVSQGIRMMDVHLDTHIRQIRRLERLLRVAPAA